MLVNDFLKHSAVSFPDNVAVKDQKKELSYALLECYAKVFAARLVKEGIKKGDRVILFFDNCVEYLITYFGILKAGAVVVPLNSQLVLRELVLVLNDCFPKIVITDKNHCLMIDEAVKLSKQQAKRLLIEDIDLSQSINKLCPFQISHKDLAMIIYTSGTTGRPKGVMLTHENLSANADSIIEYLHLTANDKMIVILPFYYSYGNSLLTTHIKVGGTLVIDNRFMYPNVVLKTMQKEQVTGFAGVPSHFIILLKKSTIRKYKFSKLRYVTQAGGAMPFAMIEEFLKIVSNIDFYIMYCQTEACARLSYLDPGYLNKKAGSIGKAIPGVELNILDEKGIPVEIGQVGEIVANGKNIMQGYWNASEETALVLKDQGLFTGDLARIDKEGFI